MWPTLFVAALLASSAQIRVEIRNSEVWVVRDGREYQLTDDGKAKSQAELSPAQNRKELRSTLCGPMVFRRVPLVFRTFFRPSRPALHRRPTYPF